LTEEDRGKPKRDSMNHVHLLITMADVANDHQHVIVGTTGPAMLRGNSHVHAIRIRTSFDPKEGNTHWHIAEDVTGPAIEGPCGEHTHFFKGETTCDAGHEHCYCGATDTSNDNDYCEDDYEEEHCNCYNSYRE